ncbi:hypothetical protein ACSDR0_45195 [Streptosporangium sp. G11]|uniref:hypothetical protein n=1 Tax=Streptosporangium sp. G11 TaxID=3436926 RepID=UPI003EB702C2
MKITRGVVASLVCVAVLASSAPAQERWVQMPAPSLQPYTRLNAIAALGADEVWVAGGEGTRSSSLLPVLQRWDGSRWKRVPIDHDVEVEVTGIDVKSGTDIWLVGNHEERMFHERSFVLHGDGTRWQDSGLLGSRLQAVRDVAADGGHVVLLGDSITVPRILPYALSWDGTQARVTMSGTAAFESVVSAAGHTRIAGAKPRDCAGSLPAVWHRARPASSSRTCP